LVPRLELPSALPLAQLSAQLWVRQLARWSAPP
jgi:hypothetical protein